MLAARGLSLSATTGALAPVPGGAVVELGDADLADAA